jgi:hypothetical protein
MVQMVGGRAASLLVEHAEIVSTCNLFILSFTVDESRYVCVEVIL